METRPLFYRGPFENCDRPCIVRDDPKGGDPIIIAELHAVHRPEELQKILGAFNPHLRTRVETNEPFNPPPHPRQIDGAQ